MLSAVIIILREVLEAALIISLLLASSSAVGIKRSWMLPAVIVGLLGALLYASFIGPVSALMDGVGQEVTNVLLNLLLFLCLTLHSYWSITTACSGGGRKSLLVVWTVFVVSVAVAIVREGAEVMVYLYGYSFVPAQFTPVLMGACIGAGIGLSIGALFYYLLVNLSRSLRIRVILTMVLLVSAGLLSESANFLIQADLLPAQQPLWNSSWLITEESLLGQLLYALLAYEATPTLYQFACYTGGLVLGILVILAALHASRTKSIGEISTC